MVELEIEGYNLITELSHIHFKIEGRKNIGHPISDSKRISHAKKYLKKHEKWFNKFEKLYKKAPNKVFQSLLYISFANMQLQFIANVELINDRKKETYIKELEKIKKELKNNIKILKRNDYISDYLRGKLALANCLYGLEKKDKSIQLIEEIKNTAKIHGIKNMVEAAESFENKSMFDLKQIRKNIRGKDYFLKDLTDEEIKKYARQTLEMMDLPEELLENLIIEYKWLQKDEIEKINHCKYIQVLQDKRHSFELENAYSINPKRKYICRKFRYQSKPGTDRTKILNEFKNIYCSLCEYKTPDKK